MRSLYRICKECVAFELVPQTLSIGRIGNGIPLSHCQRGALVFARRQSRICFAWDGGEAYGRALPAWRRIERLNHVRERDTTLLTTMNRLVLGSRPAEWRSSYRGRHRRPTLQMLTAYRGVEQREGPVNVPDRQQKTALLGVKGLRYANHSNRVDLIAVSLSGHNGRYHHLGAESCIAY